MSEDYDKNVDACGKLVPVEEKEYGLGVYCELCKQYWAVWVDKTPEGFKKVCPKCVKSYTKLWTIAEGDARKKMRDKGIDPDATTIEFEDDDDTYVDVQD